MSPTVRELLAGGRKRLLSSPFEASPREAALLLSFVLGVGEAEVLAHPEWAVAAERVDRFRELLARRLRGEPVAYLIGDREFYGRPFRVDHRVLVPRPETEHLVEAALRLQLPERPRILDLGTGSGCLAVTLALERPEAAVVATDISPAALAVARGNALRHGVDRRVRLVAGDLLEPLRALPFDLVVSNPPYVDPEDPVGLAPEVRAHEPHVALFAHRGRALTERILDSPLPAGCDLVLELGYDQGEWLQNAVAVRAHLELRRLDPDYAGILRTATLRSR